MRKAKNKIFRKAVVLSIIVIMTLSAVTVTANTINEEENIKFLYKGTYNPEPTSSPRGYVINEDFEGGIPGDWTIIDGGASTDTWTDTNPSGLTAAGGCAGIFVSFDSDDVGSGIACDEIIRTPDLNCSNPIPYILEFNHQVNSFLGDEILTVDISNDGGSTWTNLLTYGDEDVEGLVTVDITSHASGYYHVIIQWRYIGEYDYWWMFDNVKVKYPEGDDVGVESIDYPIGTIPASVITPEISAKNFGANPQTDVPVDMKISKKLFLGGVVEDFEADDGGFSDTNAIWEWGTPSNGPGSAHSGVKVWGTGLSSNYPNSANGTLESPVITVPAGGAELSFWHWYDTESYYDGGNVKVSTDGGITWTILPLDYNEDAASSSNAGIPGEPCFSGHDQGVWEEVTYAMDGYAGQDIIIRWHFGSDGSVDYPGWFIDDVVLSEIQWDLEYEETAYFDAAPGETVTVIFPDWTPNDLPTKESLFYRVEAETQLGDPEPENDYKIEYCILELVHDVGTESIIPFPGGNTYEPGTYPVEGIIANFGSYPEVNFNVHAEIQDDAGAVFWDADYMVTTPINSGDNISISFGDVTFTDADEGEYDLVITTELTGDEMPANDDKSWTFLIDIYDDIPPITTAEITGTMGDDDWYISDVTIILTAEDPWPYKSPSGVNNTYISFDGTTFDLYTGPVVVEVDGVIEFWYYSDDNNGNVEDVNGPDSFKLDATPPTIDLTAEGSGSTWTLTAEVDDATSGVAKVEFYVNDEYLGEDTEAPFEWEYTGASSGDTAQAIAYDNAGNSKISDVIDATFLQSQSHTVLKVVQQNSL